MKHALAIAITCFFALTAQADRPSPQVMMRALPETCSLLISSFTEWNLDAPDTLDAAHADLFAAREVSDSTRVAQYDLCGANVIVEMMFPKPESGRGLNESARVELSLTLNGRLVFHSECFGQHTQEMTRLPTSGVKFRPASLRLFRLGEEFRLELTGLVGDESYADGAAIQKALRFALPTNKLVNDELMENMADESIRAGNSEQ